ncbi:MAG: hypothetical protein ABI867_12345 [Kofleriaceae bacterium]
MAFPKVMALAMIAVAACGSVEGDREVVCEDQPIDVLPNGSFEDPQPPWLQDPVSPSLLCGDPQITPDSGVVAACFGGIDGTVQTLTQTLPLPEGATSASLSGRICIDTAETEAVDRDELVFDLLDGSTPIAALGKRTNQQGMAGCQFVTFALDAALSADPAEATLRIRSTLDPDRPTTFYVDSLILEIGCD